MGGFAEVAAQHFARIDERQATLEGSNKEIMGQVKDLQAQVKQLQEVSTQKCESQPAPASPSTHVAASGSGVPWELRAIAVIGNLGWDTDPVTVKARAKEVLDAAGIQPEQYVGLTAPRKEGSMAQLAFHEPASLQKARLAIRALSKTFVDQKYVWLDAKKTAAENRPSKIMHRMGEFLEDVEKDNGHGVVAKKLPRKTVEVNSNRVGSS